VGQEAAVLVKVHALVWVDGGVVVHRERRQGEQQLTLPGGRVRDREPLGEPLRRELGEERGAEARIGGLRYVAEVVHGHTVHELTLVFAAELITPLGPETLGWTRGQPTARRSRRSVPRWPRTGPPARRRRAGSATPWSRAASAWRSL
jgi:ADP-ribose pyrophosphatase YjhB (NUDIX family)